MNLKKRLTKELALTGIIYIVLILIISLLYFNLNNSISTLIKESDPTLAAMENLIMDVSNDNLLLIDYLSCEDYETALEIDKKFEESNLQCRQIENNIENLILTNALSEEQLISDYYSAEELHRQFEKIINDLTTLHKRELATGQDFTNEKMMLLEEHRVVFGQIINKSTENIASINKRNIDLRQKLLWQSRAYLGVMITLLLIFLIVLIYQINKIGTKIILPIDNIIIKTREFVDGNYKTRLHPAGEISELVDLQTNINNVFEAVEEITKTELGKNIETKLLRKECIEILDYIKSSNLNKKQVTISDLRKHLKVSHPTIQNRLKSLEDRGYITINKSGREKIVNLTLKANF